MRRTKLDAAAAPAPTGTASSKANRVALFTVLGGAAAILVGSFLDVFTGEFVGAADVSAWRARSSR